MMYGILVDTTKCTACERCVLACLEKNNLDPMEADNNRFQTQDGLSADRWSTIVAVDNGRFARKSCMHCIEPSCVSACLVGGITKSPDGPVVYDPDKCIGCRYCMLACPFHIPRYEWNKTIPFMRKCDMCSDRIAQGHQPACVEACPSGALTFGERTELLHMAHRWLDHKPSAYIARVWGEREFGGTSVLYISDVDLESIGWPETRVAAIPSLTQPLIEKTPFIGLGVATCLLGVNWIVQRRMRLAHDRHADEDVKSNLADKAGTDD
jgi:formate dehydrogenase iron-sulfur subunit